MGASKRLQARTLVASCSSDAPLPSMFMGSADAVDPLLAKVVDCVPPGSFHVDLGCGRGRLLELSAAAGNRVLGFDTDPTSVEYCRRRGVEARLGDATLALRELSDPPDVISAIHLVEHLHPAELETMLSLVEAALAPGGRLAIVTPNFRDWQVARETFWLDSTHLRPYPIPLLDAMGRTHGLTMIWSTRISGIRRRYRMRARSALGRIIFGSDYGKMNAVAVFQKVSQ